MSEPKPYKPKLYRPLAPEKPIRWETGDAIFENSSIVAAFPFMIVYLLVIGWKHAVRLSSRTVRLLARLGPRRAGAKGLDEQR